jgi:uncharacterized protein
VSIVFVNRVLELEDLNRLFFEKKPKLIILYGRRRVGKTALLNEFARKHKAVYLVARQESEKDQLKKMSEEIAVFFNDKILKLNPFQNYDALFAYLAEKEVPVLFDEFPFLVESNKALPSILQEHWDKYLSKKNSFIVLCGSSIRMMESLLGYKSPIYGRRTEQILLEPLLFRDACKFMPKCTPEEQVENYAVLGGTPAYWLEFDQKKPLITNIKEKILYKNKFLYQDVLFVIQQELNEPRTYYSIIKSIAKGNTKLGEIMNDTGIGKEKIGKYLSVLQKLRLIERNVPITEPRPKKSRKGIYVLKDQYFKFWFKFIFENTEYIEQNKPEKLLEEKIMPELNAFTGRAFEDIALEWIKNQVQYKNYLFGKWWSKNEEIDLVGIDKKNNQLIFGEVKWKNLSAKETNEIFKKLEKKTLRTEWNQNAQKNFLIIAKKFKSKKKQECTLYDLQDIINS